MRGHMTQLWKEDQCDRRETSPQTHNITPRNHSEFSHHPLTVMTHCVACWIRCTNSSERQFKYSDETAVLMVHFRDGSLIMKVMCCAFGLSTTVLQASQIQSTRDSQQQCKCDQTSRKPAELLLNVYCLSSVCKYVLHVQVKTTDAKLKAWMGPFKEF